MTSPSKQSVTSWPDRPLGGGEKLFFDESDIVAIRRRVDENPWAAAIFRALAADARTSDAEYRPQHGGRPRDPLFVQSTWLRDVALYYRISGDETRLDDVRTDLVGFFALDNMGRPLFTETAPPSWMSCGFQLIPRLAAYDLLRRHRLFLPLAGDIETRLDQYRHWVRLALANWAGSTGNLYNTTAWLIASLCTVGFLTGDDEAVTAAVESHPLCFKAFLKGFRDRLFWPEPLDYAMGYTLSSLLIIAELYRKHGRADLYAYSDPETGASLRTFVDGAVTQCFPDGRLATAGDESQQAAVVSPFQLAWQHEDVYLFRDRSPLSRYKLDILHAAYRDPVFAWLIAQDPARSCYDYCFWGYTALTHGFPLQPQVAPSAASGIYPGIGTAMLRSDESAGYWNSPATTVFLRSGRFYHSHVHFDPFSLVINAFGKNIFPDWFIPWDYLAPVKENGYANKMPFSRGPMGHNTIAVDRNPFILEWYNNLEFRPEMSLQRLSSAGGPKAQAVTIEGEFFAGIRQKRIVVLVDGYVLDIFSCESDCEHTYDYCLHSFGRLEVSGVPGMSPYRDFPADYKLQPIDSRSTSPDNVWLSPGLRGAVDSPFQATFTDEDGIGARSLFLPDSADGPFEVFTTDTPYYVSPGGYDDLPWDGVHRRMPLLILRRIAARATFTSVHQPFRAQPVPISFNGTGSVFTINGPDFVDTIDLSSMSYRRLTRGR